MNINTEKTGVSSQGSGGRGKKEALRSGYTTGACAAAAAKAAAVLLFSGEAGKRGSVKEVEIPFPDGSRVKFKIQDSKIKITGNECIASASVIKDAGDDPDVTNGAEIVAEVKIQNKEPAYRTGRHRTKITDNKNIIDNLGSVIIKGGKGVGTVTKPGLSIAVGEAAINPVPRKMIKEAVMEALIQNTEHRTQSTDERQNTEDRSQRTDNKNIIDNLGSGLWAPGSALEITISVPDGEELAKKTLNHRLGIVGGISILGTTGIVKPVSTEAWTATISSSMDVAKAMGHEEIVISAGRSSEKAHMKKFRLPEEVYVLMGDYLEYSLKEAKRHGFKKIHLCAQWAKMVKIAMATPQTHVRFGAIDTGKAVEFLKSLCSELCVPSSEFNTAREIFDLISTNSQSLTPNPFTEICNAAKKYAEAIAGGIPVNAYLVSYEGEVIAHNE
ncbi:MAG: cobalt-precorrin-5B (C(1))-methyltransferase [Nitrospiraceae bacterium]|nr:MAG: cobalt-precorrin-5B (C(1))-methyltransferase [Nitrospiraceae bacterium]